MMNRYFKRKAPFWDRLISIVLIAGGVLLILIYIPIWAWMVLFGLFLIGLGVLLRWGGGEPYENLCHKTTGVSR